MAIIRCVNHPPKGRTKNYTRSVEPVGYPASALVCGSKHCDEPGLIWLEASEAEEYQRGIRVFEAFVSSAMKFRAK